MPLPDFSGNDREIKMNKEEKAANVYFSESMQKFLSNLINDALEQAVATIKHISADDMQVMIDKAVAMEKTLQEIEAEPCDMNISMAVYRHDGGTDYVRPEVSPQMRKDEFEYAAKWLVGFTKSVADDWRDGETFEQCRARCSEEAKETFLEAVNGL